MDALLNEERFNFLTPADKAFILAFDEQMAQLGYDFGGQIGSGFCWGKYMLIYTKTGVKSKNAVARIYMRDDGVVLRVFLNSVDKHRAFIERAPLHIKEVFTGEHGKCKHCRDDKEEICRFRKTYTIDDQLIEKCNGLTFEFFQPDQSKVNDYLALFKEFFPVKKIARSSF